MVYTINWSPKAAAEYAKLDNSIKNQIDKFLEKLKDRDDPQSMGKALVGNMAGLWRYRVGDYRIVIEIKDRELVILIVSIKHRSIVYKQK
jgi:mRNA interferase RelE/StbE